MACHLPWVGVADGDFPRGVPGSRRIVPRRIVPPLFSFLIVLFVVGAPTLPSLSFSSCVSRRTRAVVRSGCLPQNHLLLGSWALDIVSGGCYQRSHHLRPDREALCGLQPTVD